MSTEQDFTNKSATESFCMTCILTERAKTPEVLRMVGNVHRQLCPTNSSVSLGRPQQLR